MILSLCFLLFPVTFAAVWNQGDRVEDLDELELIPQKSPEYVSPSFPDTIEALQNEHDDIIVLRAEIQKLKEYFRLQALFNGKEPFTRAIFFQMIDGSYFTKPHINEIIQIDNESQYEAIVGNSYYYEILGHVKHLPLFPAISLILLRSNPTEEELESLIKSACRSPHLFDGFFKYLAENIYNISRDDLYDRITKEYPLSGFPIKLGLYNSSVKCALTRVGLNRFFAGGAASLLLSYFMTPAESDRFVSGLGAIFGLYVFGNAIRVYYRSQYYGFTDVARESLKNGLRNLGDRN